MTPRNRVFEVAFALLDANERLRDGILTVAAIAGIAESDDSGVELFDRAVRQVRVELLALLAESGCDYSHRHR